ncbi:hypothetical protein AB0F68_16815 [Micromonospora sp. NPDC023966]|uniref:hypothetical protein n=1 Tax=Micromonospora sp. NPDC023966 TaxID=3154699 RepID=UPI0033F098CA
MSLTDAAIAADLAPAGLHFVERVHGDFRLPLPPHRSAASCLSEHGRFDSRPEEVVQVDDPDLPAKVNAAWWRMAAEYGLLDERREFLLCAGIEDPDAEESVLIWVRVRLLDEWDLTGSGCLLRSSFAGLFTDRFVPEFVMTSLDGRMVLETTVWGNGTVSTIVVCPDLFEESAR